MVEYLPLGSLPLLLTHFQNLLIIPYYDAPYYLF